MGTVSTVNLLIMIDKAPVSQRTGAFGTLETIVMPGLAFVADYGGSSSKPCNGALAANTLLGNKGLVAINAVELILHSCEALPTNLL